MANQNLTIIDSLSEADKRIQSKEELAGKTLMQPFSAANSGSRKILFGTQSDHVVPLVNAESPWVQTGYENRFGDYSASVIKACEQMYVEMIIPKFSFAPKMDYYIIARDPVNKQINVYHRYNCDYTTECYGYSYNNAYMDSLNIGDVIRKGDTIRKSTSYDEYNNRQDGVNLISGYISTDKNMQDSIIITKSASEKLSTVYIHKVPIVINDNNIPLNLYGGSADEPYKSFPDVGEPIKNGVLMATRLEKREESLFTQIHNRLSSIMMSDEKITVGGGIVMDIDISTNNPQILQNHFYNSQLYKYYNEKMRLSADIVNIVDSLKRDYKEYKLSYELQKLAYNCSSVLNGDLYVREDKVPSGTYMEVTVAEVMPAKKGDKIADRFGGKGVISAVIPDEMAAINELGQRLDIIINQSTCINRENLGQLMECTINHMNANLINSLKEIAISENVKFGDVTMEDIIDPIYRFLSIIVPEQADAFLKSCEEYSKHDMLKTYISSIFEDGMIYISTRPISDTLDIDRIAALYNEFPWIKQSSLLVPIQDSNGNIRHIKSRRAIVTGAKFMYRLKQFADEKFSVTAMSATNIQGMNTRSKSSKNYKSMYTNTPISTGNMENGDLSHLGIEHVISNLMIHSVSPMGRRACEEMLTGDPININIRLDDKSSNRGVEKLNAFLKAKGIRFVFKKKKRVVTPIASMDIATIDRRQPDDIAFMTPTNEAFDEDAYYEKLAAIREMQKGQIATLSLAVLDERLDPSMQLWKEQWEEYYKNPPKKSDVENTETGGN